MRVPTSLSLLVAGLSCAKAQYLLSELSFGYGPRIAEVGQTKIPNFSLQGNPAIPEILSDKVILTPPAPGNYRGGVWSEQRLEKTSWIADVEFRANGPERGTGNLNIWLVRNGEQDVGAASIYTVGKFDGLALVVDQHGGSGGMIRGFLNDGETDFKQQNSVDALAFSHCFQAYRNLGRPLQIKMRQTDAAFRVEVDGRMCFESDKIRIPAGYQLGITAASSDNPDSFEVFKLVTMSEDIGSSKDRQAGGQGAPPGKQQAQLARQQQQLLQQQLTQGGQDGGSSEDDIPDAAAESISTEQQFADLHDRLQSMKHQMFNLVRGNTEAYKTGEKRHEELSILMGELKGLVVGRMEKLDRFEIMEQRVSGVEERLRGIEREMRNLRGELAQKVKDSENAIKGFVGDNHRTLAQTVTTNAPGHGRLIAIIVGSQLLLAGGYVLYKRKKSSPKKYL